MKKPVKIEAQRTALYRDFSEFVGWSKPTGYVVTYDDGSQAWVTVAEGERVLAEVR